MRNGVYYSEAMLTQARRDILGVRHHLMGRAIEGTKVFRNQRDRKEFVERMRGLSIGVPRWCMTGC